MPHGDTQGVPTPLPARISSVIDLETTSRDAKSFAVGAYRSINLSPSLFLKMPPSPREPVFFKADVMLIHLSVVGKHSARTFSDKAPCAVDSGWVELNEFKILTRQSSTDHHAISVTGASMG